MHAIFKTDGGWDVDAAGFVTIVPSDGDILNVVRNLQQLHSGTDERPELLQMSTNLNTIKKMIDDNELSIYFMGDPSHAFEFSYGSDTYSEFWFVVPV